MIHSAFCFFYLVEYITPLVALEMESPLVCGLRNLFIEYITIFGIERSLMKQSATEQDSPGIKLAESRPQQVSILANVSMLVQFLSTMFKGIFCSCKDLMISYYL
jgi:exocyst complex component 8